MAAMRMNLKQIEALIYYGLDHGLTVSQIYLLYTDGTETENTNTIASHWKHGKKVKAIFEKVEMELKGKKQKIVEELNVETNTPTLQDIDFTDKGQFIQYLNQAANRIKDDKLKNDILKMLSDHLDFKDESKRDENNQVQRFFLPLRCQDCKLYQDAAK